MAESVRDPEVEVVPAETGPVATGPTITEPEAPEDRHSVYTRERAEYGGIKFGVAFFGWLTATGLIVLLSALAGAVLVALGVGADDLDFGAALASAVVLLSILFVSYLAGGYVAGRMARFAGAKQGLAVWIWGVVVTGILVAVAAISGPRFDVLYQAGLVPELSFGPDAMLGTVLTIVGAVVVALLGAVAGGILGMRFHRRVDRAGWAE